MSAAATTFSQSFFHGTRADLRPGDLISVGYPSNFAADKQLSWVYFTSTMDTAIWGAELAAGEKPGRIYVVEPTGAWFDDPNVTDKKFPGNPDPLLSIERSAAGDRRGRELTGSYGGTDPSDERRTGALNGRG